MSAYPDTDCPECGGKMVSRSNASTGQKFWGCADYPKCRGTRNTDGEARRVAERDDMPSDRMRGNDRSRWRHEG